MVVAAAWRDDKQAGHRFERIRRPQTINQQSLLPVAQEPQVGVGGSFLRCPSPPASRRSPTPISRPYDARPRHWHRRSQPTDAGRPRVRHSERRSCSWDATRPCLLTGMPCPDCGPRRAIRWPASAACHPAPVRLPSFLTPVE